MAYLNTLIYTFVPIASLQSKCSLVLEIRINLYYSIYTSQTHTRARAHSIQGKWQCMYVNHLGSDAYSIRELRNQNIKDITNLHQDVMGMGSLQAHTSGKAGIMLL